MLEQINIRKSQLNQKLIEFKSQRDGQDNVIKELEQQLENVKSDIKKINDTLNKYNNDLADFRLENSRLSKELSENNEKYHKLKSNLETLKNITERYEGYGSSIKKVMELKEGRKGIIGVVADIIKVD